MDKRIYNECVYYLNKELKSKSKVKNTYGKLRVWIRQRCLHKFEMPYLELFITTKCNLNCKYCSNLIPDIKNQKNISAEVIKTTIVNLLDNISRLYRLKIHGGEIFLHPELLQILDFVKHQNKIKSVRITTNGTVIPNQDIIDCLKDSSIIVQISDYDLVCNKRNQLIELLEANNIKYTYLAGQIWKNMGNYSPRETSRFKKCNIKRCTSSINGKIYVCSRAAIMAQLGIIPDEGVLIKNSTNSFRKNIKSLFAGKATACSYCDGDTEYAKSIKAGVQKEGMS